MSDSKKQQRAKPTSIYWLRPTFLRRISLKNMYFQMKSDSPQNCDGSTIRLTPWKSLCFWVYEIHFVDKNHNVAALYFTEHTERID
jgi:hypothetical protein